MILFAAAFTFVVALMAGRLFIKDTFLAFVVGSALLSDIVFILTAAHLAYPLVFLATGAAIAILCFARGRVSTAPGSPIGKPLPRAWAVVFWTGFALFGAVYILNAMAPENSPDAVWYHVALPARYLREHHFPTITTDMYAYLSEGIEMLFLFAFAFGKHSAAAMVELLFLLMAPIGILAYARRIGKPAAGVVGALLFYAAPVVGKDGTVAYVDVATAVILFALFSTLQLWRETRNNRLLIIAGILAGFAYAAKYTAFLAVIYALAFVAFYSWRERRNIWRPLLIVGSCALCFIAPWTIKNILMVSNPFAPFFNAWFENPYIYPAFEESYRQVLAHFNGVHLSEVPLEVTLRGARLQGIVGPVFLLSPIAIWALRYPAGRQLLIPATLFALPYFQNIGTRFLIPALPFVSLCLGLVLSNLPGVAFVIVAVHLIASWPWLLGHYAAQYAWRIEGMNVQAALRRIPEPAYLSSHMDTYEMGLLIDQHVPAGDPILSGSFSNRAYQSHDVIIPFGSSRGERLYDMLMRAIAPKWREYRLDFAAAKLRRMELIQQKPSHEMWSVAELRVFDGGQEVPRSPAWRLTASANPWEIPLAFDNSPLTLWRAQAPWTKPVVIGVDFGRTEQIDQVVIETPANEDDLALSVQGLSATVRQCEIEAPPQMRRAAAEEMKANGIRWMIVKDGEPFWQDLLERANQWGATQVAYSNGYRLWRID